MRIANVEIGASIEDRVVKGFSKSIALVVDVTAKRIRRNAVDTPTLLRGDSHHPKVRTQILINSSIQQPRNIS